MIRLTPHDCTAMFVAILINSEAYAANKTGVTDFLSAGEKSVTLTYSTISTSLLSGESPSTINNGAAIVPITGRIARNNLLVTANFGLTGKTNFAISHGLQSTLQEFDYTFSPNNYADTSRQEGTTDPEFGVRYMLSDKKKSEVGAIVYGAVSPAATPSETPVPEIMTNGSITSKGGNGGSGNGYTTAKIGSTLSFPVYVGNAFYNFEYIYGFVTSVTDQHGATAELTFGYEQNLSDSVTLRPYIRAAAIASSFNGQDRSESYSKYDIGAYLISDITSRFSLELSGQYSMFNNEVIHLSNGNILTLTTSAFALGLQGIFFFH